MMKRPNQLKSDLLQYIMRRFPALQNESGENLISENLLSPALVQVSTQNWKKIKEFVKIAGQLSEDSAYIQHWGPRFKDQTGLEIPRNHSICMSYDFHLSNDNLKLIEVNTNASFLALGKFFYDSQGLKNPCGQDVESKLHSDILQEVSYYSPKKENLKVAIVDENPSRQKLYAEFLCYRELMKSWGWSADILDSSQLQPGYDFIYNRDTDFYFTSARTRKLKEIFNLQTCAISPQPFEYCKLADKERMLEWMNSEQSFIQDPNQAQFFKSILLQSTPLTAETQDQIWANRKNLFIKPFRSFGSKQSYKAASISRRLFEELVQQKDLVAQEYAPAGTVSVETDEGAKEFKFDLRVYAYRSEVRSIIGRVYQGQLTNMKSPFGGFAVVQIV
jgi:hypothetical protein